jgi:hypothetical protein
MPILLLTCEKVFDRRLRKDIAKNAKISINSIGLTSAIDWSKVEYFFIGPLVIELEGI